MENVEKIDKYTVRVISRRPLQTSLLRLAKVNFIFPSDVHSAYENKTDFTKKPIGTGPYKVAAIDKDKGITLVRNDTYNSPGAYFPRGTVGTIQGIPIPDTQTQIAQLLTGGIDLMFNVPKDPANATAARPGLSLTRIPTPQLAYFGINASDNFVRHDNKALGNPKVRRASFQAINRRALVTNLISGGKDIPLNDAMCQRFQAGCDYSTKPPPYDPEAAKKLLAEAGYAGGFDTEITTTLKGRQLSVAIAKGASLAWQ